MKNFPENQFIDERVFLANGSTDFPIIVPENTLSILAPPIRVSPPSTQIVYPNSLCFCQIRFNLHYTHSGVTLTRVNRTRVLLRFQTLVPHFSHPLARSVVVSNPLISNMQRQYLLYRELFIYPCLGLRQIPNRSSLIEFVRIVGLESIVAHDRAREF